MNNRLPSVHRTSSIWDATARNSAGIIKNDGVLQPLVVLALNKKWVPINISTHNH
jgi:hypothetical protein